MVKVAIFGFGTVGGGVAEVLDQNREEIYKRTGLDIEVKYILDIREFPGHKYESKIIHDISTIIEDSEIAICCETMGGKTFAYEYTKKALEAGKSVCTSNKELVEAYGSELMQIAKAHNSSYLFEASVGGGIPIIRNISNCLTADRIEAVTGILNGTTNYMLTKMAMEGADYSEVLKEAQDKGYAERNPEADVEGHDAGRKISILSSLMCGRKVSCENLHIEGITGIDSTDFKYAKALGMSIKLLGQSVMTGDAVTAFVAPCMVAADHPLYMVNDVFNGILVHGNMLGDAMFYGAGAGMLPTASAVCADVVDLAKNIGKHISCGWSAEPAKMLSLEETSRKFFVRVKSEACAEASMVFGNVNFVELDIDMDEKAFITEIMTEKEFAQCCEALSGVIKSIRLA